MIKAGIAVLAAMVGVAVLTPYPKPPMLWQPMPTMEGGTVYLDANSIRILDTSDGIIKTFGVLLPGEPHVVKLYIVDCDSGINVSVSSWWYTGPSFPQRGDSPTRLADSTESPTQWSLDSLVMRLVCPPVMMYVLK